MTINTINSWFEKAGRLHIKFRIPILICMVLLTVIGFAGLPKLELKVDNALWRSQSAESKKASDKYKQLFGNEENIAILVKAKDVFDPEVLTAIDKLSTRLQNEVPLANQVTSLTKISISTGTEEGIVVSNPFKKGIPGAGKPASQMTDEEKKSLADKKAFIMTRKSLVNNLVSDDCTETWISLSLFPYKHATDGSLEIGYTVNSIVNSPEFKSNAYTLEATGTPYLDAQEEMIINKETVIRILSGFVVMLICLILLIRSFRGVVLTILASLLSIGSVFGYDGWLGKAGNRDLVTLPILLGMALSIGYALHFINAFQLELTKNPNRKQSVIAAIKTTGWPILFTVLTTVASFISFVFSSVPSLVWLGGISSACIFAVYLYVILLLPIFYSFGKDAPSESNHATIKQIERQKRSNALLLKSDEMYGNLGKHIIKHRIAVTVASVIIVAVSTVGITKISVNDSYFEIYGRKVSFTNELYDIMHSQLGSQESYNIMIEYPDEDAFKDPEKLKAIDECSELLGKLRLTKVCKGKPRVSSITTIVKEMNRTLNGDDPAYYAIPDDPDFLSQLFFLYEISGGTDLTSWVSEDFKAAHITIDLNGDNGPDMLLDAADAQRIANQYFPDAKVSVIGDIIDVSRMTSQLVKAEIQSFACSFAIIALMMIIAFGSIRTGLIDMIPNVAPVLVAGGIMGFFSYHLNITLMTVMPMILGIAVDDTIHFTNHVKFGIEQGNTYYDSIITTYKQIGRSMASSTLILCAMFLMYMFSPINMLFRIGLLSIVGLGSALIADYTLTPVLLYLIKPLGKEKKPVSEK